MTAVLAAPPTAPPVWVVAVDNGTRARITAALRAAGIPVGARAEAEALVLIAAPTVEAAIEACPTTPPDIVVADRFSQIGARRALRMGIGTLLRTADLTPGRLVAAVEAAHAGEGRVPYDVLVGLLGGTADRVGPTPLTPRQTGVLSLMADGHGNADIAVLLRCSEHTVKNVIYELMGRLQARNRSHAVARAIRIGLI